MQKITEKDIIKYFWSKNTNKKSDTFKNRCIYYALTHNKDNNDFKYLAKIATLNSNLINKKFEKK